MNPSLEAVSVTGRPVELPGAASGQAHGDGAICGDPVQRIDGDRVEESAVSQQAPIDHHGGEDARDADGGANRRGNGASLEPHFTPVGEVGRHGGEGDEEILDLSAVKDVGDPRRRAAPKTPQGR